MNQFLSLNFILKARENSVAGYRQFENYLDTPLSQTISSFLKKNDSSISGTFAGMDREMETEYFRFVFEIFRAFPDSWLSDFFTAHYKFAIISLITGKNPVPENLENINKAFCLEMKNSFNNKKIYSARGKYLPVLKYSALFGPSPESVFSYQKETLNRYCKDKLFIEIFKKEIDLCNIKNLAARLIKNEPGNKQVFITGGSMNIDSINKFIENKIDLREPGKTDFIIFEKELEEELYRFSKKALYNLLGYAPVYSYILLKKMEIKNKLIVLNSKFLGLKKESVLPFLYKW